MSGVSIDPSKVFDDQYLKIVIITALVGLLTNIFNNLISHFNGGIRILYDKLVEIISNRIKKKVKKPSNEYTKEFTFTHRIKDLENNQLIWNNIIDIARKNNVKFSSQHLGYYDNVTMKFSPDDKFIVSKVTVNINCKEVSSKENVSITYNMIVSLVSEDYDAIENLIKQAERMQESKLMGKQYLYKPDVSNSRSDYYFTRIEYSTLITLDDIFLDESEEIMRCINAVIEGKLDKYCILLHGEPGCGKTSIIKAILGHTKWSATEINLSQLTDEKLNTVFFNEVRSNSYSGSAYNKHSTKNHIFIMEEIDAGSDALHDRKKKAEKEKLKLLENKNQGLIVHGNSNIPNEIGQMHSGIVQNKITLGNMLTILDGIKPLSGSIIIMTTNCVEKLDEALLRDGRVDAIIELGKINERNLTKMVNKYYPNIVHKNYERYDSIFTPATITGLIKRSLTYQDFITKLEDKFIKMEKNNAESSSISVEEPESMVKQIAIDSDIQDNNDMISSPKIPVDEVQKIVCVSDQSRSDSAQIIVSETDIIKTEIGKTLTEIGEPNLQLLNLDNLDIITNYKATGPNPTLVVVGK
jgi:hypothetical protein